MLDFALKVAATRGTSTTPTSRPCAQHGFTDEDIWDIGAIAAFFALSNRMANMIAHAAERRVLRDGPLIVSVRLIVRRRSGRSRRSHGFRAATAESSVRAFGAGSVARNTGANGVVGWHTS